MSAQHQEHHHHDNPIEAAVKQAVSSAVTHPAFIQSLMGGIHEQNARASLHHAEQMRPVHINEALVKPQAYNERGDSLVLVRRRLFFVEQAVTAIVTFNKAADGTVEFSAVLYADNFNDTLSTKFIDFNDPLVADEFNRQIAEFYTPDMEGKSIQVTMLTTPGLFAKKGADQPSTDPVAAFEHKDPAVAAEAPAAPAEPVALSGIQRF